MQPDVEQTVAMVTNGVGMACMNLFPVACKELENVKVLEKIVCPEVSLTTLMLTVPETVWAVLSNVMVPETVTVILFSVMVLLKVMV